MIVRSRAPLRLGLGGGGTDVSPFCDLFGGYILNATIDMYAFATIETNPNNKIYLKALDRDESFETNLTDQLGGNGFLSLHKSVYNRIIKQFNNGQPLPLTIKTFSDAPSGSGLGSSSTVVVALLQAFCEYLNIPLGEYELAHLAYEIERKDLGWNGGKQDQYAAAFGGFNFMEFYSDDRVIVNPLRIKSWILSELEASLILYYTGVSRESAAIIDEQEKNVKESNEDSISSMKHLKEDALRMKESILKGEIKKFSHYMGKSWEAKKGTAKNISNSKIDEIYNAALKAGACSGKVSGAGGGGFMMFIVDPCRKLEVIKTLKQFNGDGQVMDCHFTKIGAQSWRVE